MSARRASIDCACIILRLPIPRTFCEEATHKKNKMTERWVSQERFYCKFCNCWISNKKSAREFHEGGNRHKGNVKKHMDEIKKNKKAADDEEADIQRELHKIRAAAGEQYKEDISKGYVVTAEAVIDPATCPFGSSRSTKDEREELSNFYAQYWAKQGVAPPMAAAAASVDPTPTKTLDAVPVLANRDVNTAYAQAALIDAEQVEREAPLGAYGPGTGWVTVEKVAREEDPDYWGPREVKEEDEQQEEQDGDQEQKQTGKKRNAPWEEEEKEEEKDPWLEEQEHTTVKEEEDVAATVVFKKRKVKAQVRKKSSS